MQNLVLTILAAGIIVIAGSSCKSNGANDNNTPDSIQLVQRGEYLVNTMGCDDCHSPKKMGAQGPEVIPELRLSGYPGDRSIHEVDTKIIQQGSVIFNYDLTGSVGPWGASFAANLTSDSSGIGTWSEPQFFKAIREGKSKGLDHNRTLLPPMPWQNFAKLNDNDLKAIYRYLKTTKPVRNVVPTPVAFTELSKVQTKKS